ncbi:hypothetical protein M5K25_007610 [Dendrobium thyrsiflorum]|uniref:Uncharacterized protein n=1 Tax=Dendrobium thyrsiflorum TaxID=117978 RepID=A0ABD0VEU0_DENTH
MGDMVGSKSLDSLAVKEGNNVTIPDVALDLLSEPIIINYSTSNVVPMDNIDICHDVINTGDVGKCLNAKDVHLNLGGFPPNCSNDPPTCLNGEIEPTVVSGLGRKDVSIAVDSDCNPLLQTPVVAQLCEETRTDIGHCEVNMVNMNDTSIVNDFVLILSPLGSDVNDEVPLINILIFIVSNDALLTQLAKDNGLDHRDWLVDSDSSANWDVGDQINVLGNDSLENLVALPWSSHCVGPVFFQMSFSGFGLPHFTFIYFL